MIHLIHLIHSSGVTGDNFDFINQIFYTLFTFILALFSAWTWQLLPHKIVHLFDTSRRAQLVVLYLLFMFTLQFFNPENDFLYIIGRTTIMFFLYLLVTKQSLTNFVFTILGFAICALITNSISYYTTKEKKIKTKEEKKTIEEIIKCLTYSRNIAITITFILLFIGVIFYFRKQIKEHPPKEGLFLFTVKFLFEGGSDQRKQTGKVVLRKFK